MLRKHQTDTLVCVKSIEIINDIEFDAFRDWCHKMLKLW